MEAEQGRGMDPRAYGGRGGSLGQGVNGVGGHSAPATVGPGISGQIERTDQVIAALQATMENAVILLKHADDLCAAICGAGEATPIRDKQTTNAPSNTRAEPSTLISRMAHRNLQMEELLAAINSAHSSMMERLNTIRSHL